jgi:hypothetical protein
MVLSGISRRKTCHVTCSRMKGLTIVGEWLSLVEHLVRDQGVGGSNPLSPTISNQALADTRRVGEKQGLPQKDLHWRKRFLCGHELPPNRSGSHAHSFNSLFPPRLVVDILGHVDRGMSHVVPRYLWPDANTAHQAGVHGAEAPKVHGGRQTKLSYRRLELPPQQIPSVDRSSSCVGEY